MLNFAPEGIAGKLHSIADSKYRNSEIKEFGMASRRTSFINTGRAARQNDPFRISALNRFE
jgi:hypothetical protein